MVFLLTSATVSSTNVVVTWNKGPAGIKEVVARDRLALSFRANTVDKLRSRKPPTSSLGKRGGPGIKDPAATCCAVVAAAVVLVVATHLISFALVS